MERIEVSVVIPARDAARTLDRQLEALASQRTDRPFEVVVADNGSTDDTRVRALAWEGRFASLRVIDASQVRGVSAARNRGVAAARSDSIIICDADDIVSPGFVEAMARALEKDDVVGGIPLTDAFADGPHPSASTLRRVEREAEESEHVLVAVTGFFDQAMGCAIGVRRPVHDAIGGFREDLVDGGDDLAYSALAQIRGYTIALAPDAFVHYRPRTTLRAHFRQQRLWSREGLRVLWEYREHGTREFSLASSLRGVASGLGRLPRLTSAEAETRIDVVRNLGNHIGEVEGNIRYRGHAILTGLGRRSVRALRGVRGLRRNDGNAGPRS